MCWHMPRFPALGSQRYKEVHYLKAALSYTHTYTAEGEGRSVGKGYNSSDLISVVEGVLEGCAFSGFLNQGGHMHNWVAEEVNRKPKKNFHRL